MMLTETPPLSESGLKALTALAITVVAWLRWGHKVSILIAKTVSVWAFIVQVAWGWLHRPKKMKRGIVMLGIENLKKIVTVVAALGNIGGKSMVDGKIDARDLVLAAELIPVFPILLSVDFMMLVPEGADIAQVEAEELVAHFKAVFDIPQDVEVKIEAVISLCVKFVGLVSEAIALFKKPTV